MKTILLLFLFLAGNAQAALTYTATIQVYNAGSFEALAGIVMHQRIKNKTIEIGEFIFSRLTDKYFGGALSAPQMNWMASNVREVFVGEEMGHA